MDTQILLEWIGYLGSAFIAIALLNNSILRLRWFSIAGNFLFIIYGYFIDAYPVVVVNLLVAITNVYYIQNLIFNKEYLKILNIKPTNLYLKEFFGHHSKEIFNFFPNFKFTPEKYNECAFIIRDMHVVCLFLASKMDKDSLLIEMDFVIPAYRDFRVGKFLYIQHIDYFRENGYRRIVSPCYNRNHERYLKKMGFKVEMLDGKRMFVKHTGLL